jgi:hypothetical protein
VEPSTVVVGKRSVFLVLIVVLAAMAPPALARGKGKDHGKDEKPLPDLVVTKAELKSDPYGLDGRAGRPAWFSETKNKGHAKADESTTRTILQGTGPGSPDIELADTLIKELKRKRSQAGTSVQELTWNAQLGGYAMKVCADAEKKVKEEDEKNNCATATDKNGSRFFFISKPNWTGFFNGDGPSDVGDPNVTEMWDSQSAYYDFVEYKGAGVFSYALSAVVAYDSSGVQETRCTWQGYAFLDQAFSREGGGMTLDWGLEQYSITNTAAGFSYPINNGHEPMCEDNSTHKGPLNPVVLTTNGDRPLPFNTRKLQGVTNDGTNGYLWNFE